MSAVALMKRAILRARAAGVIVIETPGWETRGNGLPGYVAGGPIGNIDHHLVAQLRTDEAYIRHCVDLVINGHATLDGPLCSVLTDALGRLWVIAGRPANHAGRGSSAVRERVRAGLPPGGPGPDDYTGNGWYTGNEAQHPGDDTPWPGVMVNTMAVWDAALAVEAGWNENSAIQHQEHSLRKIDCSYARGAFPGGQHRLRVAAWIKTMTGGQPGPDPTPEEDTLSAAEVTEIKKYIDDKVVLRLDGNGSSVRGVIPTTQVTLNYVLAIADAVTSGDQEIIGALKGMSGEQHREFAGRLDLIRATLAKPQQPAVVDIDVAALADQLRATLAPELAAELGRRLSA